MIVEATLYSFTVIGVITFATSREYYVTLAYTCFLGPAIVKFYYSLNLNWKNKVAFKLLGDDSLSIN